TEANSAIIDLIGDAYPIDACEIRGNNINAHTNAAINIRIGTATNTRVGANVIEVKRSNGVGIVLTASSTGTIMDGDDEFVGVEGGALAVTNASSANPFARSFPTAVNTLPATIKNDTAGGIQECSNAGICWSWDNGGTLFSAPGA